LTAVLDDTICHPYAVIIFLENGLEIAMTDQSGFSLMLHIVFFFALYLRKKYTGGF